VEHRGHLEDALGRRDVRHHGLGHFRPAGLNGEVQLGCRDFRLAAVAGLSDLVGAEPGETVVLDLGTAPPASIHHFIGANKVITRVELSGVQALAGLADHLVEFLPADVAHELLQVAGGPAFLTTDVYVHDAIERTCPRCGTRCHGQVRVWLRYHVELYLHDL
jgi:hypothetical protein